MKSGVWTVSRAVVLALVVAACTETRRPIGEECLRGDDCLSSVCSARTCVAAPAVGNGVGSPPPDETARIPAADAGPEDGATDAADGGG